MKKTQWTLGIDIGGTKIEVAGVKSNGTVFKHIRRGVRHGAKVVDIEKDIIDMAQELIVNIGHKPDAIGIGMAGQIDPGEGRVIFSPNLNWHNVPLKHDINKRLNIPVAITNDVRAATLGEWKYGAGKGYDDIVCVFVGTGIGGGIVSKGKLLEGCTNTAGEIGHITVEIDGPQCTCHNRGCLEAIASGWAIKRDAKEKVLADPVSGARLLRLAGGDPEKITAEIVAMSAHKRDPLAKNIIERVSRALIAGMVSLINAFNPCIMILGGGIIEGLPELVDRVDKGVHRYAIKSAVSHLKVVKSKLGHHAVVIGAAVFANYTFKDKGDSL
ncbi:MAG: ROK family protein [bacterium]